MASTRAGRESPVGSLREQSLYRIRLNGDAVTYVEQIWYGKRIRAVHEHTDGRLVVWSDDNRSRSSRLSGCPVGGFSDLVLRRFGLRRGGGAHVMTSSCSELASKARVTSAPSLADIPGARNTNGGYPTWRPRRGRGPGTARPSRAAPGSPGRGRAGKRDDAGSRDRRSGDIAGIVRFPKRCESDANRRRRGGGRRSLERGDARRDQFASRPTSRRYVNLTSGNSACLGAARPAGACPGRGGPS